VVIPSHYSDSATPGKPDVRFRDSAVALGHHRMVKNKSLPGDQNDRVRTTLLEILASPRFGGNKSAMAKRFGISQSMLYEFLDGNRGAGMKLLNAASKATGLSVDELLHGVSAAPAAPPPASTGTYAGDAITAFVALAEDKALACEYAAAHATTAFRSRTNGPMSAQRYLEALQEDFVRWVGDRSVHAVGDEVVPQAPELPASRHGEQHASIAGVGEHRTPKAGGRKL
jgi:transcriptional regulator with XRE-family HTH domain